MKNETNYKEIVNWGQFFPTDENKLGTFLTRSGRPINCRLDFRLTKLEELKKAAVVISELNRELQKYAYEVEGDSVLRVMLARQAFTKSQFDLRYINPAVVLKQAKEKLEAEAFVKRAEKTRKPKPVIDLGEVILGALPVVEKVLKVVPLPVKKRAIGYK
jgi:hypothetical protein